MPKAPSTSSAREILLTLLHYRHDHKISQGWVSGKEVAALAACTVNAVHQAAHRLRTSGTAIESDAGGPGVVYRIPLPPDKPSRKAFPVR